MGLRRAVMHVAATREFARADRQVPHPKLRANSVVQTFAKSTMYQPEINLFF
jgi:hypothetical protein